MDSAYSSDYITLMRKLASISAIVLLLTLSCGKEDNVDVNPGQGDDGVGDVEPGDQGDKDSGKKE